MNALLWGCGVIVAIGLLVYWIINKDLNRERAVIRRLCALDAEPLKEKSILGTSIGRSEETLKLARSITLKLEAGANSGTWNVIAHGEYVSVHVAILTGMENTVRAHAREIAQTIARWIEYTPEQIKVKNYIGRRPLDQGGAKWTGHY